jgi:hypothetical protein
MSLERVNMETKKCSCCLQVKELSLFSKDRARRDGHSYICKVCKAEKTHNWHQNNRERSRALAASWYKDNPGKARAKKSRRKAAKLKATPSWSNKEKIDILYEYSRLCSVVLKTPFHVDHVVPLKSKVVCGLHVQANLRVTSAMDNWRKGNRSWPDMWEAA